MSVSLQEQYDKVYKYCYFKVKSKDIAEDLTQETFLRYFRQSSYISRGQPLSYLYTIAKNQCIDYYSIPYCLTLGVQFISLLRCFTFCLHTLFVCQFMGLMEQMRRYSS